MVWINIMILCMPPIAKREIQQDNLFRLILNGETVGKLADTDEIDNYMRKARYELAKDSKELLLIDTDLQIESSRSVFGVIDSGHTVVNNIKEVLRKSEKETLNRSFTVKINEFTVNLASVDEVHALLQAAVHKYDPTDSYVPQLTLDATRELNVLTTVMISPEDTQSPMDLIFQDAGVAKTLTAIWKETEKEKEKDFSEYKLGLKQLDFGDNVEVVEAYLTKDELTPVQEAIDRITKDTEKEQIYEVVSGDTLSQISENTHISMEDLIDMNATLTDENSTIRVGDELIITVPQPELSVERTEEAYVEEDYEEEIQYVDNDTWYTNQTVTLQEPSAGYRKAVVNVHYRNDKEQSREVLKEEIIYKAVPKIVERGTKIPPTYLKPISGGRMSSGFGRRKAPKRGASTYHQGIDWATPVGTAVAASSSGTVTKAGWGSGYGYVVFINHGDGRETRYGHLSKVLVKPGQTVRQGQKIALSGNTGRSTGPHIHFEIRLNGGAVNPLKYLS